MNKLMVYFVVTLSMMSFWAFPLTAGVSEFLAIELGDMKSAILASGGVAFDADSLLEAVRAHEDDLVRSVAIEGLGLLQEHRACPLLRELLKEEQARFIREDAALGLAMLGHEDGFLALEEFMQDPNSPKNQLNLAERLAELGRPVGFKYVWEILERGEDPLKAAAVRALAEFLPLQDEIVEIDLPLIRKMIDLVDDPSPEVRLNVLSVLLRVAGEGYLEAEDALSIFERKALNDDDEDVREHAKRLVISWKVRAHRLRSDQTSDEESNP